MMERGSPGATAGAKMEGSNLERLEIRLKHRRLQQRARTHTHTHSWTRDWQAKPSGEGGPLGALIYSVQGHPTTMDPPA